MHGLVLALVISTTAAALPGANPIGRLRPASNRGFDELRGVGAKATDEKIGKILKRFSDRQNRLVALPRRGHGSARASSERPKRGRRSNANHAIDHDPRTAWSEAEPGSGSGAWIQVETETVAGQRAFGIVIGGGFAQSPATFRAHPRPKNLDFELRCAEGPSARYVLELSDTRRPQLFVFGPAERVEVQSPCEIKLTVSSVFPGRRFEDLAINEIRLIVSEPR